MSDDHEDWFVYDKTTVSVEDGRVSFEVVESGLTRSEAHSEIVFTKEKVAARVGGEGGDE